jgi:hypothetical protein
MDTAKRLSMIGLAYGPALVAVFGLVFSWWVPLLALGGAALGFLALGVSAARKDAADPVWRTWRCADCGATVETGATVCPRCHSVDVGDQWALLQHDRPNARYRALRAWSQRKLEQRRMYASWAEESPEWGRVFRFMVSDVAFLGRAYMVYVMSGMSLDPDDPADMRWWAAALLLIGAVFGLLGGAGHFNSWNMGFGLALALVASSAAVALGGPRAMAERVPDAGVPLQVEVNAGSGPVVDARVDFS